MLLIIISSLLFSQCVISEELSPDESEDCIPCGINEYYDDCGSYCPVTCQNRFLPRGGCIAACNGDCFCDEGFLRNNNGTCVRPSQCSPPECVLNAEYQTCGTACPRTCENIDKPPAPCIALCVEGCFCKGDLVKNEFEQCVNPLACKCDQLREEWSACGAHCEDTCDNHKILNRICTRNCVAGCVCRKPYVRGKDGKCVFPEQCPAPQPTCPDTVERWDPCPSQCPDDTCLSRDPHFECPHNNDTCNSSCVCNDGNLRNRYGYCVPEADCDPVPTCPLSNERWVWYTAHCEDTCDNYDDTNKICTKNCVAGCVCKNGFMRRDDGLCVRVEQCPPKRTEVPQCVLPEEIWVEGMGHCEDSCDYVPNPKICNSTSVSGCVCRNGLKRRDDGACVAPDNCPSCPLNEVWDLCPNQCPRDSCVKLNPKYQCPLLPLIPLSCKPDCVCQNGFLRNNAGICIPDNECPTNQTCGVNEEIPYCKNLCPPKLCSDLALQDKSCPDISGCLPGCDCISDHVRDEYGQCIRKDQCLEAQCDVNEYYAYCTSSCKDTCSTRFLPPRFCPAVCIERCECKDGYYRHDNGTCVPVSDCSPSQCVENAEYTKCGPACPATCENIDKPQNKCENSCVEGCFCKPGYVKNEFGRCIKIEACKCDQQREVWSECDVQCEDNCDNYKIPNRPCIEICTPGCICSTLYVRGKDGKCIFPEQCPVLSTITEGNQSNRSNANTSESTQQKSPNASGLSTELVTDSSSANENKETPTIEISNEVGPEFNTFTRSELNTSSLEIDADHSNEISSHSITIIEDNDWKIPLPSEVKPCQDLNEERLRCAVPYNYRPTCAEPNPPPPPNICVINGCECKPGYILSKGGKDGKCIKVSDCPVDWGCNGDKNAIVKECPQPCPSTCKAPNYPTYCKRKCVPIGCECKNGYILTENNGQCILQNQCENISNE